MITAEEFLSGAKDVKEGSVVVIGGGNTGMEVAETLCYNGREVMQMFPEGSWKLLLMQ